jgi:hypothetical protein
MNIPNFIKSFAAIATSLMSGGWIFDNAKQIPLWVAIVASILGLILIALFLLVGTMWLFHL